MISAPDPPAGEPSLRFLVWTAVALLVAYHAGVLLAFGLLPSPRIGLFLAGPVFLLAPLLVGLPAAGVRPELRLRAVPVRAALAGAAATLALVPAFLAASTWLVPEPDALEELFAEILRGRSAGELALVLAGAALAPAFSEEIFFRGFLQSALERRLGRWPGILVTAAVFGILHGATRAPVIGALGVMFGWMASRSGSVWPSILAHAATNAIAVGVVNLTGPQTPEPTGTSVALIAGAGVLLGGALLASFARALRTEERSDPSPPGEAPPPGRPAA